MVIKLNKKRTEGVLPSKRRNFKESYYPHNYHGYKYDYELEGDETEPSSGVDIYDDEDNYIATVATVQEAEDYIDELGFNKVHPGKAKISDSDFETIIDVMADYANDRISQGKPVNDEIIIDWYCRVNDEFADIYDKLWYHNEDETFVRKMASALKERGIDIGKTIYDEGYGRKKSKRNLKEAENYGWVVNSDEAWDALDAFTEVYGAEYTLESLAKAMGDDELAENLAYIFRMHDFREFYGEDDSDDEDLDEDCGKRRKKSNRD